MRPQWVVPRATRRKEQLQRTKAHEDRAVNVDTPVKLQSDILIYLHFTRNLGQNLTLSVSRPTSQYFSSSNSKLHQIRQELHMVFFNMKEEDRWVRLLKSNKIKVTFLEEHIKRYRRQNATCSLSLFLDLQRCSHKSYTALIDMSVLQISFQTYFTFAAQLCMFSLSQQARSSIATGRSVKKNSAEKNESKEWQDIRSCQEGWMEMLRCWSKNMLIRTQCHKCSRRAPNAPILRGPRTRGTQVAPATTEDYGRYGT